HIVGSRTDQNVAACAAKSPGTRNDKRRGVEPQCRIFVIELSAASEVRPVEKITGQRIVAADDGRERPATHERDDSRKLPAASQVTRQSGPARAKPAAGADWQLVHVAEREPVPGIECRKSTFGFQVIRILSASCRAAPGSPGIIVDGL